ncbi:MAG TPA: hypothetical protein VG388_06155 [Solirubrobacteraceae bacterium]|jgi:hypothetical protein|nr:hypothetical protein [Solirubrobacteraceae bacterium]
MSERERPPTEVFRAHAEFRARESPSGIGAAVTSSSFKEGGHRFDCIVTDGDVWHYIWVLAPELGPFPNIAPEDVETAVERFAVGLPAADRLGQLLDAAPLHLDRAGVVHD